MGTVYSYTARVSDSDAEDTLTLTGTAVPDWLNFNPTTGVLSGSPTINDVGVHTVRLTVSDGKAFIVQSVVLVVFEGLVVENLVQNSSFENGSASWSLGSAATVSTNDALQGMYALQVTTGTTPTTQSIPIAPGATYDVSVWINSEGLTSATAIFDTSDKYDGPGQCQFAVGSAVSGWKQFTGRFLATNSVLNVRLFGTAYTYTAVAIDPEGEPITLSAVAPDWLTFNADTGVLSGTPSSLDIGSHSVMITADDGTIYEVKIWGSTLDDSTMEAERSALVQKWIVGGGDEEGYAGWADDWGVELGTEAGDYDGFSNLFEFIADTNPTNSDSRFAIGSNPDADPSGSGMIVNWVSKAGRTYDVLGCTNLISGHFDIPIATDLVFPQNSVTVDVNQADSMSIQVNVRLQP